MVASTRRRVPTTTPPPQAPPATPPRGCQKKPSARVLEAQQSLRARARAPRVPQNEPPASTAVAPERDGRDTNLQEIAALITNLQKTIIQQNNAIANQNTIIE